MRHIAVLLSLGFMAGFLFCFFADSPYKLAYILVMLFVGMVVVFMAKTKDKSISAKRSMAAVFLLASAFAGIFSVIYTSLTVNRFAKLCNETVIIEGMVISSEPGFNSITVVKGSANGIKGRFNLMLGEQLDCGAVITAEAELSMYTDINDIVYNYSSGIYVNVDTATLLNSKDPEGIGLVYNRIVEYRDEIEDKMVNCTSKNAGVLLTAMFCGDTSKIPSEIRVKMNRCGVGHLLAISGFHVSIIAGAVAYFLSKLWINRTVSIIVSEFIMAAFVVFSGMKISSIRAYIMLSILLIAHIVNREYDTSASISVCVIIMTLINPYIVVNPSFLLSVTGVFGAAAVSAAVKAAFQVNNKLFSGLVVSICTAVIVLPITACFFDEISIVSPITSLVFIPMSSVILILCSVFAFSGGAEIMIPLVKLAGEICDIMIKMSDYISSKAVYIPIRSKYIPLILVCLGTAVFIIFAVSGNIRRTVCAALVAYSVALVSLTACFAYNANNIYLNITATNGEYLCVIYSGNDCIAINSGRDFSSKLADIQVRKGLSSPLLMISPDDENCTFYRKPLSIISFDSDIVKTVNGDRNYIGLCEISFAGLEIIASPDCITVSGEEKQITIRKGYSKDSEGDCVIYIFNGNSVVRQGDEREIHRGYFTCEYLIGKY